MKRFHLTLLLLGLGTAAHAQQAGSPAGTVIAVPPLTSPDSGNKGNQMLSVGFDISKLIESDLKQTSELAPLPTKREDYYSYPEVTAPSLYKWRTAHAKVLLMGFVQSRSDGRLTVGCYVYDVDKGREMARKGSVIAPSEWRRAAHKCSGLAYTAVTGSPGIFDTRIAYVAQSAAAAFNPAHRLREHTVETALDDHVMDRSKAEADAHRRSEELLQELLMPSEYVDKKTGAILSAAPVSPGPIHARTAAA